MLLQGMQDFLKGVEAKDLKDWDKNSYATSKFLLNCWGRYVLT